MNRFWNSCGAAARFAPALCALAFLVVAPIALAADESDFYRGRTMTIVIPIGPGGAYDAYARLVARQLGRHIPGNPSIVARNMPGGGGVIASNYLYNVAPQDGTTIAVITSSFANEQLLGNPQIKYDARNFLALGRLLDTTSVLFFWHASPIKTLADMLSRPATVAISSVNEAPAYRLNAMNRYLGTRLKPIAGYPAARDYVLAAERGETDGGTSTWIGLSQLFAPQLRDGRLRIPVQFAITRDANMAEVPTVLELAENCPGCRFAPSGLRGEAVSVFRVLVANDEIGRSVFTTPNVPTARVAVLRAAFAAMLADTEFRAEAERLSLPLATRSGEEMQKIVADLFEISPEVLAKVRELSR
jgi:tripartite-type tricarboxylate transporter receptor subunit TctC